MLYVKGSFVGKDLMPQIMIMLLPSREDTDFKININYFEQKQITSVDFHLAYLDIHDGMKYSVTD